MTAAFASMIFAEFQSELVIFVVTFSVALVLHCFHRANPLRLHAKTRKDGRVLKCVGKVVAGSPIPQTSAENLAAKRASGGTSTAPLTQSSRPCRLMDQILELMWGQPSTMDAARTLDLYDELLLLLACNSGISVCAVAQVCRKNPLNFYTALMNCAIKAGRCQHIKGLFGDMIHNGVKRTFKLYEGAMKQLAGQRRFGMALDIYDTLLADGFEPSATTCSCAVAFAVEIGDMRRAIGCFERLSALTTPSIRAYMSMLRAHGARRDWPSTVALFRDMQHRSVRIDSLALNVVLATAVAAGWVRQAEALLNEFEQPQMLKQTPEPPITDVISYNTLIKGYSQDGNLESAFKVLHRMRTRGLQPNAVTFNTAMDAAVRSRKGEAAWELLQEMRNSGLSPDKFSCSILMRALVQCPTRDRIFIGLKVLRETDGECDKNLKVRLYPTVADAAAHLGDNELVKAVLRQMKELDISIPDWPATGAKLHCFDVQVVAG